MESILYQIFSGEYDITPEWGKTQQEIRSRLFTELDQVEAVLGEPFLDRLIDLGGEWSEHQNFHYFRAGFLLGARLMLEALGD